VRVVDILLAQAELGRLLDEAAAGAEVVIARSGEPVARLVALRQPARSLGPRPFGLGKGTVWISDDFDAPLPEFEDWERE